MTTYRCDLTILLKRDIYLPNLIETLSRENINQAIDAFPKTKQMHRQKGFKPYCIGAIHPIEKDKVYKKGREYRLPIVSFSQELLFDVLMALMNYKGLDFDIKNSDIKKLNYAYIDKLISKTPAVLSLPEKVNDKVMYWDIERGDIDRLQKQIKDNLEKKHKQFFGKEIKAPADFINLFAIKNQKPIFVNYKGGKIVGNKFQLGINSDEVSQKLASLALSVGLLEKNSLGFGYVEVGR